MLGRLRASSPGGLFVKALADYRQHWLTLWATVALVSVPVSLISGYIVSTASDSTLSAYLSFAQLTMNVAAVYAVTRIVRRKAVRVSEAYYRGSAMLIRLILVSVLLVLMALFLVFSAFIIGAGVVAPGTALSGVEQFLLVVLALAVAVPSVLLLARGMWATYIIFDTDKGPIAAVRHSRAITRGKTRNVLRHLLVLGLMLLVVMAVPLIVLIVLFELTKWTIFTVLLQIIASLVILPLANLYLYRYYLELS